MGEGASTSTGRIGDWTVGPAKWAAGGLLAGASTMGLIWVLTARDPAPIRTAHAGPITILNEARPEEPLPVPEPRESSGSPEQGAGASQPVNDMPVAAAPPVEPEEISPARLALCPVPEAAASTLVRYVAPPAPAPAPRPAPPATREQESPRVTTRDDAAPPTREEPQTPPVIGARINVNTASAEELDLLPGVGPVIAQRILEERQQNGPFRDLNDLQRVRGIGPKTAQKMADHVRFD